MIPDAPQLGRGRVWGTSAHSPRMRGLTFMAVRSSEAFVTVTGEFASRLTLALPVGTADIGGNIAHPFRRVIGGHGHRAAVNHCETDLGSDPRQGPEDPVFLSPGPMPRLLSWSQAP